MKCMPKKFNSKPLGVLKMSFVYTCKSTVEAKLILEILRQVNIKAISKEDSTRIGVHEVGIPYDATAIYVEEEDMESAIKTISEYFKASTASERAHQVQPWQCEKCSELIEPQFTACWNCGNDR